MSKTVNFPGVWGKSFAGGALTGERTIRTTRLRRQGRKNLVYRLGFDAENPNRAISKVLPEFVNSPGFSPYDHLALPFVDVPVSSLTPSVDTLPLPDAADVVHEFDATLTYVEDHEATYYFSPSWHVVGDQYYSSGAFKAYYERTHSLQYNEPEVWFTHATRDGNSITFELAANGGTYLKALNAPNRRNDYAVDTIEIEFNEVSTILFATPTEVEPGIIRYLLTYSRPFSATGNGPIRARVTNELGVKSAWCTLRLIPFADFSFQEPEEIAENWPRLVLDASASFDADGSITLYRWWIGKASASGAPIETAEPILDVDVSELLVSFNEGQQIPVTLQVVDNDNTPPPSGNMSGWSTGPHSSRYVTKYFTYEELGEQIGSLVTPAGVLYTAVNDGQDVQLHRFPSGVASREDMARIEGHRNPAIRQRPDGAIRLMANRRSDGITRVLESTDGGRTFS